MTYLTPPKSVTIAATDYNASLGDYRNRSIAGTGGHRFTFYKIPSDVITIVSLKLLGNVSAGAAQTSRDIDFLFSYHTEDEVNNQHSDSDTSSTYDLSAHSSKTYGFELKDKISSLAANDILGIFVDHKTIGGSIYYFGIELLYLTN